MSDRSDGGAAHEATSGTPRGKRVAVVYHYFAHYRHSIVSALSSSTAHSFTFFADTRDPLPSGVKSLEAADFGRFEHVRCRHVGGPFLWQPGAIRVALRRDIDVVIYLGNMYMAWTWPAAVLARLSGKRVLFWTHGWRAPETGIQGRLRALFYRLAHGLLVYEHRAKAIAIENGFDADSVHVVYNSLDMTAQRQAESEIGEGDLAAFRQEMFGNDDPVVICVSRITRAKGIDQLVKASRLLADEGHPLNLLVVGEGAEREALEHEAREAGISAKFTGPVYDEAYLARCFGIASVAVCPGPVGLLVIHSFAYGRPLIANDDWTSQGPEWGAVIPGKNGDHFQNGDVRSLADVIVRWTTPASGDDEHAARADTVAQACRQVVDDAYNADYQRDVIERAAAGDAADDLFRVYRRLARREAALDSARTV